MINMSSFPQFKIRGKNAQEFDQFMTHPSIAERCLDLVESTLTNLNKNFSLATFDTVIDPCFGNGAFASLLAKRCRRLISMDLDAEDPSLRQDFLTYKYGIKAPRLSPQKI